MNRLQAELHRLYLANVPQEPDTDATASGLIDPEGRVRALVLELARPADWEALSPLWQGVQVDLELPAPAIAVSGIDGYQLWFSLSQPVPAEQAQAFLEALRLRYLGHIAAERIRLTPAMHASAPWQVRHARLVPALQQETGRWSAFVVPGLATLLADDPGLDMPPSPDAQAELLSRLESTPPADFQRALDRLRPATEPATPHAAPAPADTAGAQAGPPGTGGAPASQPLDPKRFLLAVMNDHAIELHLRIEAAKALLPYFEDLPRG